MRRSPLARPDRTKQLPGQPRADGAIGDQPQAFYDLFRVEDGLIVEHWDVIAPMPGADTQYNEAGKF